MHDLNLDIRTVPYRPMAFIFSSETLNRAKLPGQNPPDGD
jgi:hypothetical protein